MKSMQQGVALITAMLIVAIIATLATSLALGQQVWLRQTQNLVDLAQAEQLRQGAYEYVAAVLVRDEKSSLTNKSDNLQEAWAQPIPPLPVEGGVVAISINDAQARFNLNNLVQQGQPVNDEIEIFRRLLAQLGLSADLVNPLIDWLDADSNTLPGGAEDLDYLNLDPPYRAANRPLRSVDELRLVKGYTAEIVNELSKHVVALPESAQRKPINVNTASAEVLAALAGTDIEQAKKTIQVRDNKPFENPGEFKALYGNSQLLHPNTYNVKSEFFIVTVETRIGRIQRRTEALIDRSFGNAAKADVVWYRQPPISFTLDEDKS